MSRQLGDPNLGAVIPGQIFGTFGKEDQTCTVAGEWMFGIFLKNTKAPVIDHYTAYPLPQVNPDGFGNILWGRAFVVNANSDHKEAAFRMIGDVLIGDPNSFVAR